MAVYKRKFEICKRPYSITVKNETEEIYLNNAVKLINERVEDIKSNHITNDSQDLMAMVALEIAYMYVSREIDNDFIHGELFDRLKKINNELEKAV